VKICVVLGTRPEAIKLAPVIQKLKMHRGYKTEVVSTGQHRELLEGLLGLFSIQCDFEFGVMRQGQSLSDTLSEILKVFDQYLLNQAPDLVIAQGDTTTVLGSALACFHRNIPFAHVEAGLRSDNRLSPFPEEVNRVLVAKMADLHFAPTERAKANLIREGVRENSVTVSGNTGIDACLSVASQQSQEGNKFKLKYPGKKLLLVTVHRRENFGEGLQHICDSLIAIQDRYQDLQIIVPVHPNPQVREVVTARLGTKEGISLIPPLNYGEVVGLMSCAYAVMSDSGGLQEECPALGVPLLILRRETERPETVECGSSMLVGVERESIVRAFIELREKVGRYDSMAQRRYPFGDGNASAVIVNEVVKFLSCQL